MEILDSLEVRWFVEHGSHEELAKWFADVPPETDSREDYYLVTGLNDVGVKARLVGGKPAKLETKLRLGALNDVELLAAVVGHVERWRKLSLDAGDPGLRRSGEWIKVGKERRLRKLRWLDGVVDEVAPRDRPAMGCGFELTRLSVGTRTEWTLGFEAFGATTQLLSILMACARHALAGRPPPAGLCAGTSAGYPAWLQFRHATPA
jgi:hypothetical protein